MLRKFKMGWIVLGTALALMMGSIVTTHAAVIEPTLQSKAGLLMDSATGQVIASKNDRQRLPIASVSKLIVIYMTEHAIQTGKFTHDTKVKISKEVADFSADTSIANVPMSTNQEYTIKQLEEAALLPSSNAAAIALAEKLSGSQKAYYNDAEKLLSSWGIKNTKIYSASGLRDGDMRMFNDDATKDTAENKLSAREVAVIAQKLITRYPKVLNITEKESIAFPSTTGATTTIKSTDRLLGQTNYDVRGLKTGTTPNDGNNFVGVETLKGQRVISVVLNGADQNNFSDTKKLLTQTDQETTIQAIHSKINALVLNAKVAKGQVKLINRSVKVFVQNGEDATLVQKSKNIKTDLKAPLTEQKKVHQAKLKFKQAALNDFVSPYYLEYHPTKDVEKTNFVVTFFRKLTN